MRYRCAFAAQKTHYIVTQDESTQEGTYNDFTRFESHKEASAYLKGVKDWQDREYFRKYELWSRKEVQPVEFALQATKTALESILEKLEPTQTYIYLTGKDNFRDKVAVTKPYKGNREKTEKPVWFKEVGEYLSNHYGAGVSAGVEADDLIGIDATRLGSGSVMVTNDKDLDQIPGWHYNWVDNKLYNVNRRDADFAFYSQVLSGDATDNIPGLPGVGPAKSRGILEGASSSRDLFLRTWKAYRDHVGDPAHAWDYMTEQATLVYILRQHPRHEGHYKLPMSIEEAENALAS